MSYGNGSERGPGPNGSKGEYISLDNHHGPITSMNISTSTNRKTQRRDLPRGYILQKSKTMIMI